MRCQKWSWPPIACHSDQPNLPKCYAGELMQADTHHIGFIKPPNARTSIAAPISMSWSSSIYGWGRQFLIFKSISKCLPRCERIFDSPLSISNATLHGYYACWLGNQVLSCRLTSRVPESLTPTVSTHISLHRSSACQAVERAFHNPRK